MCSGYSPDESRCFPTISFHEVVGDLSRSRTIQGLQVRVSTCPTAFSVSHYLQPTFGIPGLSVIAPNGARMRLRHSPAILTATMPCQGHRRQRLPTLARSGCHGSPPGVHTVAVSHRSGANKAYCVRTPSAVDRDNSSGDPPHALTGLTCSGPDGLVPVSTGQGTPPAGAL